MKKALEKLKTSFKKLHILKFLTNYIEDILMICGLIVAVKTTFLLSKIAGLYTLSAVLLGLGVYFAKNPPERR
ncbi:hypothetical protein [Rhodopseudomonas parapalustris]